MKNKTFKVIYKLKSEPETVYELQNIPNEYRSNSEIIVKRIRESRNSLIFPYHPCRMVDCSKCGFNTTRYEDSIDICYLGDGGRHIDPATIKIRAEK